MHWAIYNRKEQSNYMDYIKIPMDIEKRSFEIIGEENKSKKISIIASGDPCFYGVTDYIKRNIKEEPIEIIPGLSSFQYLMSKIGKSWNGKFLGSVHGREEDFLTVVKENSMCIFLTDSKNSPKVLANKLFIENISCNIWVGENLSYEDEKITVGTPEEIKLI